MPIIHIEMLAGRSTDVKQALARRLIEAVTETMGVSPESVQILLHEVEAEHWFVGGRPIKLKPAAPTKDEGA